MTHPGITRAFDAPEYDAGYAEGFYAWSEADETERDGEPPEHLTEGLSARRRDGFRDGWGDAALGGMTVREYLGALSRSDAARRIRDAARNGWHGWQCRLRYRHVRFMAERIDDWVALGLPGAAACRITKASRELRGVRLTAAECRAIRLPQETP